MDDDRCLEWCPICRSAEVLRGSVGSEVLGQWNSIQRNGLIVLRELLDAQIRQLEDDRGKRAPEPESESEPEPLPESEPDDPFAALIGPPVEFEPLDDELAAIYRRFSHSPAE